MRKNEEPKSNERRLSWNKGLKSKDKKKRKRLKNWPDKKLKGFA